MYTIDRQRYIQGMSWRKLLNQFLMVFEDIRDFFSITYFDINQDQICKNSAETMITKPYQQNS